MSEDSGDLKEKLSEEEVGLILQNAKKDGFLQSFRGEVEHGKFFSEYSDTHPNSKTGTALLRFLLHMENQSANASPGSEITLKKNLYLSYLRVGSNQREVMLAYWGVRRDDSWSDTEPRIIGTQTYNDPEFPNRAGHLDRVLNNLNN